MASVELITFRDAIDHLAHVLGGAPDERNQFAIRSAIINAYRDLVQKRNWSYFYGVHRLQLAAPYSTGTVAYTHSTRTLTLTGGTWPTWALYGHVKIGDVISRVQSRTSDTVVVLDSVHNPGADVAAGTTFTIFRSIYNLPADFRSMSRPVGENSWWVSNYISPADWNLMERANHSSGTPTCWTVLGDPNLYGSSAIAVFPYPDTAESYDFVYQRWGRPLIRSGLGVEDYTGTASTTADSVTVSGNGTSFLAAHVGAVIRFTSSASIPPDGLSGNNPYAEQKIIVARNSLTSLTVDTAFSETFNQKKYVISDPLDLAPKMLTAFYRKCEAEIAHLKDRDNVDQALRRYRLALLEAFEADSISMDTEYVGIGPVVGRGPFKYMPYTAPS